MPDFLRINGFGFTNKSLDKIPDMIYRIYKDIKGLEAFAELVMYITREDQYYKCKYEEDTTWSIITLLIQTLSK
jgi:hypothetical protein